MSSEETPPVASPDGVRAPAGGGVLASRPCPVCQKALGPHPPGGVQRPVSGSPEPASEGRGPAKAMGDPGAARGDVGEAEG